MWARTDLDNNVLVEFFNEDPTGKVFSGFRVVELTGPFAEYAVTGYVVDDTNTVLPPSADYLRDQLLAVTANKRWMEQQADRVTYKNAVFGTDDATRTNISQAIQLADKAEAQKTGSFTTRWKAPGGFVSLNAADVVQVGLLLAARFQSHFNHESDVTDALAETEDDVNAVLSAWTTAMEAAWPVNTQDPASEFFGADVQPTE